MIYKNPYDEIFRQYYKKIYDFCYSRLHDEYAAEDITQEVFLSLYIHQDRLKLSDNIVAWLYTAAKNAIITYIKKNGRELPTEDEKLNIPIEELFYEESLLSEVLDKSEIEIINAVYNEGRAVAELAEEYGITEMAMRSKIQRIRIKAKTKLGNNNK